MSQQISLISVILMQKYKYPIFGPPKKLPKYLEEFGADNAFKRDLICKGPEISICKGVGDRQHKFLSADGVTTCYLCKHVLCCECQQNIAKATYCLQCYASESLVPKSASLDAK